jgi:group I intron endonuclease
MGCVYLARCKVNGKGYVGKTVGSLDVRKADHRKGIRNESRQIFYRALRKYGWDAFEWTILTEDDDEEWLFLMEQKWIKRLGTKTPGGYNMTDGGEGASGAQWTDESRKRASESAKRRGPRKQSEEERKKRSQTLKGRQVSDKMRMAVSESNRRRKGEKRTEETKKKISESKIGWKMSEEQKERLREARTGKKHTEETKMKLSAITSARKGNPKYRHSIETIERLKIAARNRPPVSDETKKKMRLSRLGKKRGPYRKKENVQSDCCTCV